MRMGSIRVLWESIRKIRTQDVLEKWFDELAESCDIWGKNVYFCDLFLMYWDSVSFRARRKLRIEFSLISRMRVRVTQKTCQFLEIKCWWWQQLEHDSRLERLVLLLTWKSRRKKSRDKRFLLLLLTLIW
jgi:hypothetical protein